MADFLLLGQQQAGSYALSETKARMFYQALTSVLDNIAETINSQAVPALLELNPWWDIDELPYITHGKIELPNLETLGSFIERLVGAGMKLFPDDRLENHLRSLADLPLKDAKKARDRAGREKRPAKPAPRQGHETGQGPGIEEGESEKVVA